jgi:soluble lytic murein transglycosylase
MLRAASRRSSLSALATLCVTCQAQVTPAPSHAEGEPEVTTPAPAASTAPARFDPEIARVDPSSALGRARALLEAGDHAGARAQAIAALESADSEQRPSLAFVAGRASERAGDTAAAIASFAAIDDAHPLARAARLAGARALIESDPAAAIALLATLDDGDRATGSDAQALRAIARARSSEDGAEPALRAAIEITTGATRGELERALAELLAPRDDVDARIEAIRLLRWIDARAPGSRQAREALERIVPLAATIPVDRQDEIETPTIEQQIARAEALAAAMEHRGAEDAYAAVVPRLAGDPARRCEARLGQGRAMWRRRARREAASLLVTNAEECRELPEVRAWSRYYAAKSYSGQDRPQEAIAQYDVLAEEQPEHRLADDALVTAARLADDVGDHDGMRARLERVVTSMPSGDLRGEARFLLAWNAREEGRLESALAHLEGSLAEGTGETAEDVIGRAAYWRARVLEQLARPSDAATRYEELARAQPLSYYAQLAMARLSAIDAERARAVLPAHGPPPPLTFAPIPELSTDALRRAVALLRVGEIASAERELAAAGLTREDAPDETVWIAAALLDRAGAHGKAMELARRRLRSALMSAPPTGRALALWRIAYPRAFHPQLDDAAGAAAVPAAFVRAIAREESSFRPDAMSVAHAYGLLQLIQPTAQRIARPLGLPSDPVSLRRPEINLALGARYIASLRARYGGNPALVPAAYNAGEGAVDRWLREGSARELDEFVEEIPYDETRRYSRRVLQTWGIYAWLDEGARPEWPRGLPSARRAGASPVSPAGER